VNSSLNNSRFIQHNNVIETPLSLCKSSLSNKQLTGVNMTTDIKAQIKEFRIGEKIRALRQQKRLTLQELSELTTLSKPLLSQIENQQVIPPLATLLKIARGLKVDIHFFFADLTVVDAQLVPGLIFIDASPDLAYLFVCDTNERPAYHFVASDGATHSAWEVRHPDAYLPALAELAADELHAGAAQVIAAHVAGQMPLVILTSDRDVATATGPLAPRCGLFIPRPSQR
jgi:transcriptional regulator with XRE-family HTH domain